MSERSSSSSSSDSSQHGRNEWTDEHEATLKTWGEEAMGLSWMHGRCEKWFTWWDRLIGIPAGLLAVLVSISIFANSTPHLWLRILQGVVSFLAGAMVFLQNFLDFGKRARGHGDARIHYQCHGKSIADELSLLRIDRMKAGPFFRNKQKEHETLILADYPPILDRYIKEYKEKFSDANIARPLVTDALNAIVVRNDIESGGVRRADKVDSGVVAEMIRRETDNPMTKYELNRYHAHEDV